VRSKLHVYVCVPRATSERQSVFAVILFVFGGFAGSRGSRVATAVADGFVVAAVVVTIAGVAAMVGTGAGAGIGAGAGGGGTVEARSSASISSNCLRSVSAIMKISEPGRL
jgi:hypothetical protein